jgi:hypothetical protein
MCIDSYINENILNKKYSVKVVYLIQRLSLMLWLLYANNIFSYFLIFNNLNSTVLFRSTHPHYLILLFPAGLIPQQCHFLMF